MECGKEIGSPLVSLIGKTSFFMFSSMVWVGEIGSSSPMGSSKILGCSHRGLYNSLVVRDESSKSTKRNEG